MVYYIKRRGYKKIIFEPAKSRLKKKQCPSCGNPKSKWVRRIDWRCCSVECTNKYQNMYISYGWPDFRLKAFKRDNFTCVKCGNKPKIFRERYESETDENFKWRAESYNKKIFIKYVKNGYLVHDSSKLIGDHIIPIVLGVEEFDMDNIQTLCIKCHKEKTSKDIKEIVKARKIST